MDYYEQLKHPKWQKKRLEVMEEANFACCVCGKTDKQLNVHHTYYKRKARVWEYENYELECLCSDCHKTEHSLIDNINEAISVLGREEKLRLLGYADGLYMPHMRLNCEEYNEGFADALRGDTEGLLSTHKRAYLTDK